MLDNNFKKSFIFVQLTFVSGRNMCQETVLHSGGVFRSQMGGGKTGLLGKGAIWVLGGGGQIRPLWHSL